MDVTRREATSVAGLYGEASIAGRLVRSARSTPLKALALAGFWLCYIIAFPHLYAIGRGSTAAISALGVLCAAWWLSWPVGVGLSLLSIPLNLALIGLVEGQPYVGLLGLPNPGNALLPVVALLIGGLRTALTALDAQAAQLRRERAALAESEARYRSISELTSDYVYMVSVEGDGRIVNRWVTDAFATITGYSAAELEAAGGWVKIIYADDLPVALARARRLMAGETDVTEFRIVRRDGALRWLRDYARPVRDPETGAVTALLGAVRDITEQRLADDSLRQMMRDNLLLARAVAAAADGIVVVDARNRAHPLTYVNPAFTRITGYSADEILGRNCRFLQGPGTDPAAIALLSQAISERREVSVALLNYRKDGQAFWNDLRIAPVWAEDGELLAFIGVQTDITARKQAEEALRAREATLRLITAQLPAVIWTVDTRLRITSAMGADLERVSTTFPSYLGAPLSAIFGSDNPELPALAAHLRALEGASASYVLAVLDKEYDVQVEPLRDHTGAIIGCLSMGLDTTERKQRERWLQLNARRAATRANLSKALAEAHLDLPTVLSTLTAHAAEALGDFCAIRLLEQHAPRGRLAALYHSDHVRAASLGQALSADAEVDPARLGLGSALVVPLRARGVHLGAMLVGRDEPAQPLDADDEQFAHDLAERAALAILSAQLFEASQRRLAYLQALTLVDRTISASLSAEVTLEACLDQVISLLNGDAATVMLADEQTGQLRCVAARGFYSRLVYDLPLGRGEGLAGRAVQEGAPLVVEDLRGDARAERAAMLKAERFIAYAAAPLLAKGQALGVLEAFQRRPNAWDDERSEVLQLLAGQVAIALNNASLFERMGQARQALANAYESTIEGWSRALDLRDKETEGHSRRVTDMTLSLARALGLGEAELVPIRHGALLHDIGKMGIPDAILLKPGPLTDAEWEVMRMHPTYAYNLLSPIAHLRPALDIPYCHHEKWDGSGYPRGLKGEQIPLAARIFAVADVWDALQSDRPYRKGWPRERIIAHIASLAGSHFDPQVVAAFLRLQHAPA